MKSALMFVVFTAIVAAGIYSFNTTSNEQPSDYAIHTKKPQDISGLSIATFSGGCFWCVEAAFEAVPGVREAISGFSGGDLANPTYEEVAYGLTKHTEAVQVYYDPMIITYEGLLQVLWRTADPTDSKGQFSDRGRQYRPAIFFHDEEQERTAIRIRQELEKSGRYDDPVTIEILPFKAFYPAEKDHQDYYLKHPWRYRFYTIGSGRAGFQKETWKDDLAIDFSKYRPPQTAKQNTKPTESMDM